MKNVITILTSLSLFYGCFSRAGKITTETELPDSISRVEKAVLHHVSFDIMTFAAVPCNEFEDSFSNDIQRDTITDPCEIALLQTYMERLIRWDSVKFKEIDTRAKLYFISSSDTAIYCLNSVAVYHNGTIYLISDELREYVESFQR